MKFSIVLMCILLFSFFVGCDTFYNWESTMARNNENLLKLEMNMSKEQVISIMGKPLFNEAYKSIKGKSLIIYFYFTERKIADGSMTKDECTPIVFEDGLLIGWGSEFYKVKLEIDVNVKNTP